MAHALELCLKSHWGHSLCATSVSSESLWLMIRGQYSPPRLRGHRDCTEKPARKVLWRQSRLSAFTHFPNSTLSRGPKLKTTFNLDYTAAHAELIHYRAA